MKKDKKKNCFCAIECVNGSCPRALANEHNSRDDDVYIAYEGMENMSCNKCYYNTGLCKDCIFENNAEICSEYNKENPDNLC